MAGVIEDEARAEPGAVAALTANRWYCTCERRKQAIDAALSQAGDQGNEPEGDYLPPV